MALPTLDATFASSADLPRKQMLAKWLVEELGETQAPSDVLVSGLQGGGSYLPDGPNGLYVYAGTENGKSKYEYAAQFEEPEVPVGIFILKWESGDNTWYILAPSTDPLARAIEDTTYPWQSTLWEAYDTGFGTPVITEFPAPSPLSNYYSLPEHHLWAKIAVAAGAPKTEADYISLPKNYVWSDIYNAVSGDISNSTVVVSGAGTASSNGTYVRDGTVSGKPRYAYLGNYLVWSIGDSSWTIEDETLGDVSYVAANDTSYPWQATEWTVSNGEGPVPTLTVQTPNHTDWSENAALGHIAAAYRGDTGNPANLATYIDWPWRYKVASIIQAL